MKEQTPVSRRVNEQAREACATVLLFDIADPVLHDVTIMGCRVSPDRTNCTVYYSAHANKYDAVAQAFARAEGAIRTCVAKRLNWRVAPALRFVRDDSVDESLKIAAALDNEASELEAIRPADEEDLTLHYRNLSE